MEFNKVWKAKNKAGVVRAYKGADAAIREVGVHRNIIRPLESCIQAKVGKFENLI
jgi:hypothetical protein